ncbi:unnamed protein product [Owenia fusiformis]|uniref:TBC1 domain family member 31 n=1 Tax=Owenia fusiformis TaxID=6347 RepID=A0A8J1Y813_OWEFU|nr:unnamed protein product [Owenia fusiformis]
MQVSLDVHGKESGKIWHRKPTPGSCDGHVCTICNLMSSAISLPSRKIRFLQAAFDATGDSFIAADYQGNIFVFDLDRNRFAQVQRIGTPCTAIAFNLRRKTEYLVALADCTIKCFDTDTKELVAWMKGHSSPIHTISVHASGRYAITCSADTAQLWDLDTFLRKRKLSIKENVGITKVFFLPLSNTIITCFKDDSIFAWESDTLVCKYQLPIPDEEETPHYKDFSVSRDGRILVAGSRSRFLHLWTLDTKTLHKVVQLPTKVKVVKQLEFLADSFDGGASQVLCVLAQDGILRAVSISTCKLLFDLGSIENRINSFILGPTGRHIVSVHEDGDMKVWSVAALTQQLNQPPPPMVRVIESNKMADSADQSAVARSLTKVPTGRRSKRKTGQSKSDGSIGEGLNKDKLFSILRGYGEYPAKYRGFIWRCLLKLPENHTAYAALVDKGTHSMYANIHQQYPIKSRKLLRILQRTLSCIAHWSPIFGETQFLPLMAFPFVKLFQNNQLVCFEIIASILVNWCQHWFEFFPNPPINMLAMVENLLGHHDKHLLQHFVKYGVTSQIYAWPLLETVMSEVLTKDEWLMVWDNIFSNPPGYMLLLIVAYCICNRGPLMNCTELDDFKYFFHHRNAVDVREVIEEAYRLQKGTPNDVNPEVKLEDFQSLTKGQYPVFNKFPKFIVDYQVREREKIQKEEEEYLRQRQLTLELHREAEKHRREEGNWQRQQEILQQAEERRKHILAEEEQKLQDQRTRMQALNREVQLKELELLDATRRKAMHQQTKQAQKQLRNLDEEILKKVAMRDVETEAAVTDAEVKNLELQLQKKCLEQELLRKQEQSILKHNMTTDAHRKVREFEDKLLKETVKEESKRNRNDRKTAVERLARSQHEQQDSELASQLQRRHLADDLDAAQRIKQMEEMQSFNQTIEQEINDLMGDLENIQDTISPAKFNNKIKDRVKDQIGTSESNKCLNDSPSDTSVQFSLDRGRHRMDTREQDLMADVRRLREKLAHDSRMMRPPLVGQ